MKYMKMAAIAMMALALFSCNKKDEPKKAEAAALNIHISDATLRALEGTVAVDTETGVTSDVVLTLHPSGRQITMSNDDISAAKSTDGKTYDVGEVVTKVSLTANYKVSPEPEITAFQGQQETFTTTMPLEAKATNVTVGTDPQDSKTTIYSVTLEPKPIVARVEVAGDIMAGLNNAGLPKNNSQKTAYKSIKVEQVYINNYLLTRNAENRTYIKGQAGNFASTPDTKMCDEIKEAKQADFKAKKLVAGYQLFPIKENEAASEHSYYDHIILRLTVTYDTEVAKGYPTEPQTRYVTMVRFMKENTGDLKSFEAGTIYKLGLEELTKDFTTDDNGNPTGPDTPNPEQEGKMLLNVKVKPYKWETVNIKPDVNGGYKK